MQIKQITARQIFDSRGNPTIEADVILENGAFGRAAVPSGASTGKHEALELRDELKSFGGLGVSKALANINDLISPKLIGQNAENQTDIDGALKLLDGTENKSHLGANACLAVSLANAKAAAKASNQPFYRYVAGLVSNNELVLPMPMFNILNGGQHARGSTDFQEFMIVPSGLTDFRKALEAGSEIFHSLGIILAEQCANTNVGDEGGYAPSLDNNQAALELISQAITKAGYQIGEEIGMALDVAASEFWDSGSYRLAKEAKNMDSGELIKLYKEMIDKFPIISIEDGLGEEDWANWPILTQELGTKIMIVTDDLTVTNPNLLQKAINQKAANTILIKPNQIGTLSETIEAVQMAKQNGWKTIMSHRSGETEDVTIAHLAVGLGTDFIKAGSLSRSERLAKYNELLRIGEELPTFSMQA